MNLRPSANVANLLFKVKQLAHLGERREKKYTRD